jgi:hypothetical protein
MAGNDVFIAQRSAPGDPLARVVVTGSTGVATNHATGVAVVGQKGSGFFTLGTDRTTITVYGADAAVTRTITLPTALPSFYYTSASASGDVFYFMAAANDAQLYRVDATGTTPVVTTTVLAQGGNLTTAVKASRLMIAQSTNSLIVGTNNSNNGDDKIWRITLNADGSVASQTQLMTTGGSFYGTSQGFIRSGKLYYAQGSSVYAQDLTTGVAEAVTTVSGVPLIDSIVASGTDAYLSGGNRKLYKLSL